MAGALVINIGIGILCNAATSDARASGGRPDLRMSLESTQQHTTMNLAPFVPYIGTAATSAFALGMWQYQLIAKRRYEVVEQALTAVGEATRKLHYIRAADMDAKEQAKRQPGFIPSSPFGTTYPRIEETASVFHELDAAGRAIAIHFGERAAAGIRELATIYGRVCGAQAAIYFIRPEEKLYPGPGQEALVAEWKTTLNAQPGGDEISREIDAAARQVEAEFKNYLRPGFWRFFIPFFR
jgi:hypothetical protein